MFSGFDDRGSRKVGIDQYGTRTRTGRRGLGVSSNQRTGSPIVNARQLWQGQMEMGRERIHRFRFIFVGCDCCDCPWQGVLIDGVLEVSCGLATHRMPHPWENQIFLDSVNVPHSYVLKPVLQALWKSLTG